MLMQNAQPLICDARVDQFDQRLFEAAALHLRFKRAERFDGVGRGLIGVQPGFHAVLLRFILVDMAIARHPDK
jgi:hypothetical protein